jgi:hypothetical protein
MTTRLTTDFKAGRFYSVEEVFQGELWQTLTKGSSTQLLGLKALAAKSMSQPLQISIKSIRSFFGSILEAYNDKIKDIGQPKNLIKTEKF